ncbi:MAG: DUF3108 domain-containing protein [Pseudomonadota bacterium]
MRQSRPSRQRSPLLSVIAVLVTAPIFALPPAVSAMEQSAGWPFVVSWGNVTLAEGTFRVADGPEQYSVLATGETRGPLNFLFSWKGRLEATGARTDAGRQPDRYERVAETTSGARRVQLDWEQGRFANAVVEPRPDLAEVTAVDPEQIRGVVDPLSFFAGVLDRASESGGADCATTGRLWDGERLSEIRVETLGQSTVESDRPWDYEGRTLSCRLFFKQLGGFQRENRWRSPEAETMRILHLAQVEGRWAPVRLELASPLGRVVGRLRVR